MECRIVVEYTKKRFEEEVNKSIKEGSKPQGGLSVKGGRLYQAMIKEKE